MYQIIDGKKVANQIKEEIAAEVADIKKKGGKIPHLVAILVGADGASETYVSHKEKACETVGIKSTVVRMMESVTENELLEKIAEFNRDDDIDGMIVQLPLPDHISEHRVIEAVDPKKDVDGFHPANVGRMFIGLPSYVSATPAGIIELLSRYKIETSGKSCVVIGRSNIVGKPVSILLSRKTSRGNATVTLCHSRTPNIAELSSKADIIIVAMGKAGFLTADMVKEGAVVIDVGITRIRSDKTKSGWKLVGDVAFDEVAPKCSFITPVPGGVGPMTIVSLLKNTLMASRMER
ncbi:MAG: bifunctional 5,10-methylene-tetrahydrofolate dehydrogenase/5,10-methylene-tetrahydrofolate cyclohydrolase [Bacteroidetes bacterium]|nr:bifunctional 5,10-methylene-tetrahydrofolate dehydrogenase/5,10-methylene-tetrahydrofolate cyclohydrolase [Bacteroidota bacterium]